MSTAHRLSDPADIRAFVGAGNAYFTLRNAETGGRVTYNVTREDDGTMTVRAFTGSDNSDRRHYGYLGTVDADGRYAYGGTRAAVAGLAARTAPFTPRQAAVLDDRCRRHGVTAAAAALPADDVRARGFAWFWRVLGSGRAFPAAFEFWHEGRCAACARRLTVPQSIATGFGPECAARRGIVMITLPIAA